MPDALRNKLDSSTADDENDEDKETTKTTTTIMKLLPSGSRRWISLAMGCFHTLFTGGMLFGWSSFEKIIDHRGIFLGVCDGKSITIEASAGGNCDRRTEIMAWILVLGIVGNYSNSITFGFILDYWGSKVCSVLASSVVILGALLCMNYEPLGEYAIYAGYFFLGHGGPSVQLACLPMAQLFPHHRAIVTSILAALFDGSTLIFLVMKFAYFNNSLTWISMWVIYLAILAVIFVTGAIFHPQRYALVTRAGNEKKSLRDEEGGRVSGTFDDDYDNERSNEHQQQHQEQQQQQQQEQQQQEQRRESMRVSRGEGHSEEYPEKEELKSLTFKNQLKRSQWWYCCVFMCIHLTHVNFLVLTMNKQLESLRIDPWYGDVFATCLPFGFVGIPVTAYLIDNKPEAWAFTYVNFLYLALGITSSFLKYPVLRIMCFVLVAIVRQASFGLFFYLHGTDFWVC